MIDMSVETLLFRNIVFEAGTRGIQERQGPRDPITLKLESLVGLKRLARMKGLVAWHFLGTVFVLRRGIDG